MLMLLLLLLISTPALTLISAEIAEGDITNRAFQCLVDPKYDLNYDSVILQANLIESGTPVIEPSIISNIGKAKKAGLSVQIYIDICRPVDPNVLVDNIYSSIAAHNTTYTTFWVKVQNNFVPGCKWDGYTQQQNCQYVKKIIDRITAHRRKLSGIYSDIQAWNKLLGANCKNIGQLTSQPKLWFAAYGPGGVLDTTQSYRCYTAFGGWIWPTVKQISRPIRVNLCGGNTTLTVIEHWRRQ